MILNSISDIGVRRKDNQDNYWSAVLSIDGEDSAILCVCDGMGGLNNGGLASKIVVQSVMEAIKEGTPFEELTGVLEQANGVVYDLGSEAKMGTTCTLLQCSCGSYKILHIGDSRCYKFTKNSFDVLTKDHSVIKEFGISRESDPVKYKKYKNLLTRCIGVKPEISVDYYEGKYEEGDIFLVCSDGVWHYFDKHVISENILSDLPSLVKKCIGAGETDNITASVLYC